MVSDQELISVIVPVYNVEKYLRQCLDSITGQTLTNLEIICVDDGSTDGSMDILEEYAAKDDRIIILKQENGGAGKARNTGLTAAKGRYLSFLDSDDFFEPDMLESAWREIRKKKASFVVFRSDAYHTGKGQFSAMPLTIRDREIVFSEPLTYRSTRGNVFLALMGWAWDKLYDADFIRRNGLKFQEIRTTNDMVFVLSALLLADSYAVIDRVLAHYRMNDVSSLSNTRERSWFCFHDALAALKENIVSYGMFRELERDYVNYCLRFSLWNLETLAKPFRDVLYEKLKTEWFREFGISGKPDPYFADRLELRKLRMIEKYSADKYFRMISILNLPMRIKKKIDHIRH